MEGAERRLLTLWVAAQRASWVQETFITPDTEEMAAEADQAVKAATAELAAQARRYEGLQLPEDVARKLKLIKPFGGYSCAARYSREHGTLADQRVAAKRLRKREVVPGRSAGKMPFIERHRTR